MSFKNREFLSHKMALDGVDLGFGFNESVFSDRVLHIIEDYRVSQGDFVADGESVRKDPYKQYAIVPVKTLHINSLVLAANSPFFYKLLKNGTRESQQSLRINPSDAATLMDIIKFMYSNTLSATSVPDLMGVLRLAEKFEVTSCIRYCTDMLKKMPMSLASALLCLGLHPMGELVEPLIDAAKKYLATRYSSLFNPKTIEEMMGLPLCAIQVVLGNDDIQVDSEDEVFDFIVYWADRNYPELEERREIVTKHLMQYVYFSNMSPCKLKEVLVCPAFGHEQVSKLVLEALFVQVQATTDCCSLISRRYYKHRPVKVVQINCCQPRCIVYFDLKKQECENLFQSTRLRSQSFWLGGRWFYLSASCGGSKYNKKYILAMFVQIKEETEECTIEYEIASIDKSSKEFQYKVKGNYSNSRLRDPSPACILMLPIPWTEFISEDSKYFIDGTLHLRVDLTINNLKD